MQSNLGRVLSDADSGHRDNLVVVVRGFEEDGKETDVRGIEPRTRQEVRVALTTTGPEAENPRRISLAKLRDGYRVQRQIYRLEPGGVIAFSRAVSTGKGTYEAPWPEVLAYDHQQAKETCARFEHGMVIMAEDPKPDRSPGDLFVFQPENGFKADTPEKVSEGVAEFLSSPVRKCTPAGGRTFLLVARDCAGDGNEKPRTRMQRSLITKDGDQWRPMDPDEAARWMLKSAKAMSLGWQECCFGVVPVEVYRLSKMLDPEKVRVPAMAFYATAARNYGARTVYVKLSGFPEDKERFINSFFVEGPYGQRGGLEPASLVFG